jgi:hypothetical protein
VNLCIDWAFIIEMVRGDQGRIWQLNLRLKMIRGDQCKFCQLVFKLEMKRGDKWNFKLRGYERTKVKFCS